MTTAATTAAATNLRRERPGKVIAAFGKSFPSARRGADSRPRVPVYRDDPAKMGAGHNTADSRLGCGLRPGKLGSLCRTEKASAAANFTVASALAEVRAKKASAAANAPVVTALAEAQEGVAALNTPVATTLAEAQKGHMSSLYLAIWCPLGWFTHLTGKKWQRMKFSKALQMAEEHIQRTVTTVLR
ncbi:hypothetical protein CsSME_00001724 [Camellia sinensis var. sinensis]